MSVDTASPSTSPSDTTSFDTASFDTSTLQCAAYPSEKDLNRLARALRSAACDRDLSDQVAERYEAWIYLFLGWCLQAPPGRVHKDRVGDFWGALTQRQVPRWKVCEAMDAVGFLFGILGGPEAFSVPGASKSTDPSVSDPPLSGPDSSESRTLSREKPAYRLNPTLHASGPASPPDDAAPNATTPAEAGQEGGNKNLSDYLPEGPLPMGVDARAAVPTAEPAEAKANVSPSKSSSSPENSAPPEDAASSEDPASSEQRARGDSPDGPKTLFNPKGSADAEDPTKTSLETLFPQDDPSEETGSREENGLSEEKSPPGEGSAKSPCGTGKAKEENVQPGHVRSTETSTPPTDKAVSIPIPEPVAERVRKAARKLGLPPRVFAARALDLVCEEAGVERSNSLDSEAPLERYQTQLDVLHLSEHAHFESPKDAEHAGDPQDAGDPKNAGEHEEGDHPRDAGVFLGAHSPQSPLRKN